MIIEFKAASENIKAEQSIIDMGNAINTLENLPDEVVFNTFVIEEESNAAMSSREAIGNCIKRLLELDNRLMAREFMGDLMEHGLMTL